MTPLRVVASLLMFAAMCVTCASAQDWAKAKLEKSPRHGEWVTIKHGSRDVQAFVVYPEVKTKAPVVAPGSPSSTVTCAPGGINGGAGPHGICASV